MENEDEKTEHIFEGIERIALPDASKSRIERVLRAYMELHPRKNAAFFASLRESISGRAFFSASFLKTLSVTLATVLFIFGVEHTAGNTLPDDFLYPIKRFDEGVYRLLTRSDIISADTEAYFTEKRLGEIEDLAYQGRLTPAINKRTAVDFSDYIEETEKRIVAMQEKGATAFTIAHISSHLEASLSAHERILMALLKSADSNAGESGNINPLLEELRFRLHNVSASREEIESMIGKESEPELRVASEVQLADVIETIKKIQTFLGEAPYLFDKTTKGYVDAQLERMNIKMSEGKNNMEKGEYGKAWVLFQEVSRASKELDLLIQARKKYHIEIADF